MKLDEYKEQEMAVSRRVFVTERTSFFVAVAAATAFGNTIAPAVAVDDVSLKTSIRTIKLCQRKISTLQDMLFMQDYYGVKAAFRTEPFSTLRKNASTIVRWTEENSTDGTRVSQIEDQYKTLIASLERIDGLATVGMRGKEMDGVQISESYSTFSKALESFVSMAPTAESIGE